MREHIEALMEKGWLFVVNKHEAGNRYHAHIHLLDEDGQEVGSYHFQHETEEGAADGLDEHIGKHHGELSEQTRTPV